MPELFDILLILIALLIAVPIGVFTVECLAAVLPGRRWVAGVGAESSERSPRHHTSCALPAVDRSPSANPSVAVLIPAHNEQAVIEPTLRGLLPMLTATDRIIVVADNCTDNTAELARQCGATVIERTDADRRGKGYALAFGVDFLRSDPPDVVVVIDADCRTDENAVALLSRRAHQTGRPVQGRNLCEAGDRSTGVQVISELGFRFANLVRPNGLARLGLPCELMGTGMAFPWKILENAPLAGDHLAEDKQLGMELALAGHSVLFCPAAGVTSTLPSSERGFASQRTRWEQGQLRTALTWVPRLLLAGIRQRRLELIGMAADLSVPPLSLLVLAWAAASGLSLSAVLLGGSRWPALILGTAGLSLIASILLGWAAFCRERIPLSALLKIPLYLFRKLPIYAGWIVHRRPATWVRTER